MGGGGRSCTVIGCLSRSSTQKDKHFYRFPSDTTFKEIWITFTRRGNDYQIKKSSVVCQDHFDPSCFVVKKKQICLAKNTIPTIFYRSTQEGEIEKYVLTFDRDVMHYVEEDTLLNPVYDKEKHEAELLTKKQRKLEAISKLCRFCLECDENLIEINKLKDYSINPNEVLALVGLNPKHNDLFSKNACEECFQQIFIFDGYRKRCKKSQDLFVDEINEIEMEIQKLFGYSGQGSWMKKERSWMKRETTNWSDDEEEEEATFLNESFESSQMSPLKQSTVFQFQKIVVKEEQKDCESDEELQDFHIPSVANDDECFPTKTENDAIGITAIKALTKYETDSYDIKDVFMPEKNQSSNSRIYECFYCRLKYAGKVTFTKHRCTIKEIRCEFPSCGKIFTKLSGFNSHITKLHKLPKIKRQYCSYCKLSKSTTEEEFKEHSKRCEINAKKNIEVAITCESCGKVCPTSRAFAIHMMFHTTGNKSFNVDDEPDPSDSKKVKYKKRQRGIFICETCGKEFATKRYLSDHTRRVHSVSDNPEILTCDHCGKTRTTRYALSKHIRNVHISMPSPCSVCGKVFRNKPLLQAHMIYHKDYKRIHFCPLCPDKPPYVTAVALKRHQESNHGFGNGYHCEICDAVYKTRPGLSQHKLQAHSHASQGGFHFDTSLQRYL